VWDNQATLRAGTAFSLDCADVQLHYTGARKENQMDQLTNDREMIRGLIYWYERAEDRDDRKITRDFVLNPHGEYEPLPFLFETDDGSAVDPGIVDLLRKMDLDHRQDLVSALKDIDQGVSANEVIRKYCYRAL
jgi:hypothetical protein